MHKHETTVKFESKEFPGVTAIIFRMTEGRRLKLRATIATEQRRLREIMREQSLLEKTGGSEGETTDISAWLQLQEEFDELVLTRVNPEWVTWGVKRIEGLEVDGRVLGVEDWKDWPSALFQEVIEAVKAESELGGAAKKNSSSDIISTELEQSTQKLSTVLLANGKVSGETEIVNDTSQST